MRDVLLRRAVLPSVIALQVGCTTQLPDRYAHCDDLGTLRLASTSIAEAEDRMLAQVAIMGGDLLLFSARGHVEDTDEVPTPLTQRRKALARVPAISNNGRQPELAALVASTGQVTETEQELWYYGAALRCKTTP